MAEEEISFDKDKIKQGFDKTKKFFMNRKVQAIIVGILLLGVIFIASDMRTQNMDLLEDSTTGKKIPLALDPFYFLRVAETQVANGGELPKVDEMRSPVVSDRGFTDEILPDAIIGVWKVGQLFDSDLTLRHADVLSPVVFFALGVLAFFFLILALTRNKWTALVSSAVLAFVPSYLYRTMAGFSDHEAIGMVAFFLVMAGFTYGMKHLYGYKGNWKTASIYGAVVGVLATLSIVSWGGVAELVFVILPLAFFVFWLTQTHYKNENYSERLKYISFYVSWVVFSVLGALLFKTTMSSVINGYMLSGQGVVVPFVLAFIVIDSVLIGLYNKKDKISEKFKRLEKYRALFSVGITVVVGLIGVLIFENQFGGVIDSIIDRLVRPAGTGRLGTTVAENRAPFLSQWVGQVGQMFFWMFIAGLLFVGHKISQGIEERKYRGSFMLLWVILLAGIILSRISQNSLLDGTNTFSLIVYFGSLIVFLLGTLYIYVNSKFTMKAELAVIFSWMVFMLIATRGSVRMLFIVTPFMAFMGIYAIQNCIEYWRKSKDELAKVIFIAGAVLFAILLVLSFTNYVSAMDRQAQGTGPSADGQWQQAMEWVRTATPKNSIFGHWWDYGYWVQYLGERPTIMDGGFRPNGLAHLFGRYVLTTKRPETALSLMKTHNVSHLLIDHSDLGKYGAYSSIGSGPDRQDRRSTIPVMSLVPSQIKETQNSTKRLYQGGRGVDEDIVYNKSGEQIFLPKGKAGIAGVEITTKKTSEGVEIQQPEGIFVYQGEQFRIPLKNVYFNEELKSFDSGINATAMIVPSVSRGQRGGASINQFGSLIYLSQRTSGTLFAELYLMDDPRDKYPTVNLAHSQPDPLVQNFKRQGADINEFLVHNRFRGPIKIWNVTYPDNIVRNEKLLEKPQPYGSYDNITFSTR
ncbi:MAG: STT3 domain-containing protein [Candidatus Pacearchaeota archaeon]